MFHCSECGRLIDWYVMQSTIVVDTRRWVVLTHIFLCCTAEYRLYESSDWLARFYGLPFVVSLWTAGRSPFFIGDFFFEVANGDLFAFQVIVFAPQSEEIEPALGGMNLTTLRDVPRSVSLFSRFAVARKSDSYCSSSPDFVATRTST